MYKGKYKKTLDMEPAIVTLAGEEFKLHHIDKTKDIPSRTKGVIEAVKLMKDKRDWDNLPHLLAGMKNAKRKFAPSIRNRIMGRAAANGRMDVMLECARRVDYTGFQLNDPDLVLDFLRGIMYKAVALGERDAKETEQALVWAEMVADMLEDERHSGKRNIVENDPRASREVVGILLDLAAMRATQRNGKDEDGKVVRYAERLLGTSFLSSPPEDGIKRLTGRIQAMNRWLQINVLVLHGIKVAGQVLDPSTKVAVELEQIGTSLEETVNRERERMIQEVASNEAKKDLKFLALNYYDKLLGQQTS